MRASLDELLRALEPSRLPTRDAAAVLKAASAIERRAAIIKTLVAARAAESDEWANAGHRSPESWLGAVTGSGFGEAAATLTASNRLDDLPGVGEAARNGELSGPQLRELGAAATEDNEEELLDAAKKGSVDQLRKKCARAKAAKRTDDNERRRRDRIHNERYFRSWTDSDGAYRFEGKATAAAGARIEAALGVVADRVFKAAWKEGRRERLGAYQLDALVELLTTGGARSVTQVVIRVDVSRLAGGEGSCETSAGSVPVNDAIGAILAGAFTKIVLRDGVDVTKVSHHRRHLPAEVRTAVIERDGYGCVRPGCGATQRLQTHHYKIDFGDNGPTAYWNLATLCRHDHDLITNHGHLLAGGPGNWRWIAPARSAA
ncbi:MAG: HNH endonuclease [Actinobacteria bacterium]|nr:HNH endonuclease [Actinomycetota bacterium]